MGFKMVTILKSEVQQAREGMGALRRQRQVEPDPEWWTFDLVRDRLVDVAHLWWRSPGGQGAAYATDGPWRQMIRETRAGDYDARGGDGSSSDVAIRPLPLSVAEVDMRDRCSQWLLLVPGEDDRRLVVLAVEALARGNARVPWRAIKRQLGIPFGEDGLKRRFDKALSAIVKALNRADGRVDLANCSV